jgi:hypothetical protein
MAVAVRSVCLYRRELINLSLVHNLRPALKLQVWTEKFLQAATSLQMLLGIHCLGVGF